MDSDMGYPFLPTGCGWLCTDEAHKPGNGSLHVVDFVEWFTATCQFVPFTGVADKLDRTTETP